MICFQKFLAPELVGILLPRTYFGLSLGEPPCLDTCHKPMTQNHTPDSWGTQLCTKLLLFLFHGKRFRCAIAKEVTTVSLMQMQTCIDICMIIIDMVELGLHGFWDVRSRSNVAELETDPNPRAWMFIKAQISSLVGYGITFLPGECNEHGTPNLTEPLLLAACCLRTSRLHGLAQSGLPRSELRMVDVGWATAQGTWCHHWYPGWCDKQQIICVGLVRPGGDELGGLFGCHSGWNDNLQLVLPKWKYSRERGTHGRDLCFHMA